MGKYLKKQKIREKFGSKKWTNMTDTNEIKHNEKYTFKHWGERMLRTYKFYKIKKSGVQISKRNSEQNREQS